jgi:GABA permease
VLANQTVVSEELLDAIRARNAEGPASFLVVVPHNDEDEDERAADRRLRLALTELSSEGIDAHGQIEHPDPDNAEMEVTDEQGTDEIIVSTFPGERSGGAARPRLAPAERHEPAGTARRLRREGCGMTAHAEEHHGPPPIHYSSRVSPLVLGMFLFIGSEIMLFGSFFTVYFFDRVVTTGSTGGGRRRRFTGPCSSPA